MKLVTTAIIAFATMTTPMEKETKTVNTETSKVTWKGYKVGGSHEGTIAIKSGSLEFDGETLVGGSFVIDMNTIGATDLSGEYKEKLDGHLKSDDFFGVANYPTASLLFTLVEATGNNTYRVTGDLTIKKATHPVTFTLNVNEGSAVAELKIDRSKYDVRYGSPSFFNNLKDNVIYNDFDIKAELKF
ncbi:MAG: YceI family protein [Flavobacteriaceae bacterium]|nr:YceI family protein [Mangrovimonas sp.]MCB0434387.1 YceI family protein [Mangrovimonas sp.]MCB0437666.1 YceI family protein [Mangrovimonas sp.]HRV56379.1 YceI family protein [Mangrovimonas sp.]